jgi:hypothetical protein
MDTRPAKAGTPYLRCSFLDEREEKREIESVWRDAMKSKPPPDELAAAYEAIKAELEAQRGVQQRLAVQYAVV